MPRITCPSNDDELCRCSFLTLGQTNGFTDCFFFVSLRYCSPAKLDRILENFSALRGWLMSCVVQNGKN